MGLGSLYFSEISGESSRKVLTLKLMTLQFDKQLILDYVDYLTRRYKYFQKNVKILKILEQKLFILMIPIRTKPICEFFN